MERTFDLQGHRGARGLAPENTLAGFTTALSIGVTTLETDLLVTRDDVVVLTHDPLLNPNLTRGPDGRWLLPPVPAVRGLTLTELQRYDVGRIDPASQYASAFPAQVAADGERIPTLAALFALGEASGKSPRYNLEVKSSPHAADLTPPPDAFAALTIAAVRDAGLASRVTIQSFDWRVVLAVRRLAPDIATAALTVDTPEECTVRAAGGGVSPWLAGLDARLPDAPLPQLVKAARCATWSPFWRNLDGTGLALAHRLGVRVVPWTINDPSDMSALIDLGVDGLITDYPDRARVVLVRT